ncbi:hypothetical protein V5O48_016101 [Marasmius crinis-equi]|uniref:F-box domain-containing protein n=1 Tax=Marasmius crinis-equi TaxID=585013 RepID=A0ABR3ESR3_9AGAR
MERRPEVYPQIRCLLHVLAQAPNCWESISLWLPPTLLEDPVFSPIRTQLSSLKHLTLHPSERFGDDKCLEVFRDCPSITSLRLHVIGDRVDPSRFLVPWRQLTKLHLHWCTFTHVAPILKLCTELEDLSLSFVWTDPMEPEPFVPIVCPRLKTLSVESFTKDNPLSAVVCMTLPGLSRLDIQIEVAAYYPRNFTRAPLDFVGFLNRSACTITELHVRPSLVGNDMQLVRFLDRFPALRILSVVENQFGEWREDVELDPDDEDVERLLSATVITTTFLNRLHAHYRGSPGKTLIPRLTDLTLSVQGRQLDQEALVAAVTSRWLPDFGYASEIGVDCLRSLSIRVMEKDLTPLHTLETLCYLRDAGLRVDIYRVPC